MLITVFGAGGQTGQLVVAELLGKGHSVRAFLRDPSKLAISDPHLEVRVGDARDPSAVNAAVEGADAVISTLGASRKDKEPVFAVVVEIVLLSKPLL